MVKQVFKIDKKAVKERKARDKAEKERITALHDQYANEGSALYEQGKFSEAIEQFQKALTYIPDSAPSIALVAACAMECEDYILAQKLFQKAMELDPNHSTVLSNCAKFWDAQGYNDLAEKFYSAALVKKPNSKVLQQNYARILVSNGSLGVGWDRFEIRHELAHELNQRLTRARPRFFPQPQWDGSHLIGKKLIVWGEQGVGDEILFGTMLKDLEKFGGQIVVETDPRLVPLFQRSLPSFKIVPRPYVPAEEGSEHFDCQIAFMSLARHLRRNISDFPTECHFLKPAPEAVQKWQTRFDAISDRPKIGLSWRSIHLEYYRNKSFAQIDELGPIAAMDNVDFINMQYSYTNEELETFEKLFNRPLYNWTDIDLKDDFDEVAAYTSCLTANISPGTTPVNISGALSIPTHLFLNHQNADTKPNNLLTLGQNRHMWLPSVKLHHRTTQGQNYDWTQTFEEIAEDVQKNLLNTQTLTLQ